MRGLCVAVLFTLAVLFSPLSEVNAEDATVTLEVDRVVRVGDLFNVIIQAHNVTNLAGATLEVAFDPEHLECLSIDAGTVFEDGNSLATSKLDNTQGIASLTVAVMNEADVLSGTGVIATLGFYAKQQGPTQLGFVPQTGLVLGAWGGNGIPTSSETLEFAVSARVVHGTPGEDSEDEQEAPTPSAPVSEEPAPESFVVTLTDEELNTLICESSDDTVEITVPSSEDSESEGAYAEVNSVQLTNRQVAALGSRTLAVVAADGGRIIVSPEAVAHVQQSGDGLEIEWGAVDNGAAIQVLAESGASTEVVYAREINANLKGPTTLRLPLPTGSSTKGLRVFVKHSDGTTENLNPTIFTDETGRLFAEVTIDRFSTFILYRELKRKRVEHQIGSNTAIVNGKMLTLDARPYIHPKTWRTFVPIRFISEALGARVRWEPSTKQVIVTEGEREIVLTNNSPTVMVDGRMVTIDSPAHIVGNRTFVPIRFVSETLGAEVQYIKATKDIVIRR